MIFCSQLLEELRVSLTKAFPYQAVEVFTVFRLLKYVLGGITRNLGHDMAKAAIHRGNRNSSQLHIGDQYCSRFIKVRENFKNTRDYVVAIYISKLQH